MEIGYEISEMFKCIGLHGLNNYGVGTRDTTSILFILCASSILFILCASSILFIMWDSQECNKKGREKNESTHEKTKGAVVTLTTATVHVASIRLISVLDSKKTSKTSYKKAKIT